MLLQRVRGMSTSDGKVGDIGTLDGKGGDIGTLDGKGCRVLRETNNMHFSCDFVSLIMQNAGGSEYTGGP